MAVGCSNGTVKLWNIVGNELMASLEDIKGPVDMINFCENGYFLAVGSSISKEARIWDLRNGNSIQNLNEKEDFGVSCIDFDEIGSIVGLGNVEGEIKLIDTKKWNTLSIGKFHNGKINAIRYCKLV